MSSLPKQGRAIVKLALSGDSFVLRGRPVNGPPPEMQLSLANVVAPRLGTVKEPEKEEPFAYESREYVRKLLVGKEISYAVTYSVNGRDYGTVTIPVQIQGETDLARILVKEGVVRARPAKGTPTEDQLTLARLESEAAPVGKGVHGKPKAPRQVNYAIPEEPTVFFKKWQGKTIDAVVEQVRDASNLRVAFNVGENMQQQVITVGLTGVKAPACRKDVPNVPDMVEPFGEEAKFYVEVRVLQKNVKIILESFANNNFLASIKTPAGDLGELLLSEGYAKVQDWSASMVTGGSKGLRDAEAQAKAKNIRLWKEFVPKASSSIGSQEGVVTRILQGDTIVVELTNGKEKKISLSSLKAPKAKDPNEAFYANEAKEFLRSRLIGKKVSVKYEYTKPASEGYESKDCGTVKLGDQNMAEALVKNGLATVIRHKKDDDNRSSQYDVLLLAEEKAKAEKRGLFSEKEPPSLRIADVSENAVKAKQYLPFLQRAGTLAAVVDHCASGSRFRVFVPSQNCRFTLVLGGIRAPKVGRTPQDKSDPFGPEALEFVNRNVLQRDVEVSVEAVDKVGGFIGSLFLVAPGSAKDSGSRVVGMGPVSSNVGKNNVACKLLEKGLAQIHEYSAQQSAFRQELFAAERIAKEGRHGLWSLHDPSKEEAVESSHDIGNGPLPAEVKSVVVSDISDGRIHVQINSAELNKLAGFMARFAKYHSSARDPATNPRAGEFVSAQFTADDAWYRARIRKVNPDKTYLVQYVDYGNTETLPGSRLRSLDSEFNLDVLPPQANECTLAFIDIPHGDDDYADEAFDFLKSLTEGFNLRARFISKKSGVNSVLLYSEGGLKSGVSINEELVRQGFATVSPAFAKKIEDHLSSLSLADQLVRAKSKSANHPRNTVMDVVEALISVQDEAKKAHLNIWRYGDFRGDEGDY